MIPDSNTKWYLSDTNKLLLGCGCGGGGAGPVLLAGALVAVRVTLALRGPAAAALGPVRRVVWVGGALLALGLGFRGGRVVAVVVVLGPWGAAAGHVGVAGLLAGGFGGSLLRDVVVVGRVLVLEEDLGLVLAQPAVDAVGVADGQLLFAERGLRGAQVQGTVVGAGGVEGGVLEQLVEGQQVLFLVGGRHVAGGVLAEVDAVGRGGQVGGDGVGDGGVEGGQRLVEGLDGRGIVQLVGAVGVLVGGDGAGVQLLAQVVQGGVGGAGGGEGGRVAVGGVLQVEALAGRDARLGVEVEQGVEQLVVLGLQAAGGAHGLPLLHDEVVALVHGVVELDAHLAVLAPGGGSVGEGVGGGGRCAYLQERLTGGRRAASAGSGGASGAGAGASGGASVAMGWGCDAGGWVVWVQVVLWAGAGRVVGAGPGGAALRCCAPGPVELRPQGPPLQLRGRPFWHPPPRRLRAAASVRPSRPSSAQSTPIPSPARHSSPPLAHVRPARCLRCEPPPSRAPAAPRRLVHSKTLSAASPAAPTLPPPQRPAATAKLSPILLNRTARLSFAGDPRPHRLSPDRAPNGLMSLDAKEARRRRSSSLVYKEPPESLEQLSDQAALPNLNAEWVNAKGEPAPPTPRSCWLT